MEIARPGIIWSYTDMTYQVMLIILCEYLPRIDVANGLVNTVNSMSQWGQFALCMVEPYIRCAALSHYVYPMPLKTETKCNEVFQYKDKLQIY